MADWQDGHWEPSFDAPTPAARRGGRYRSYVPDLLLGRSLALPADLALRAGQVEAAVRALPVGGRATSLEGLARFLLRSEAIASSRIEGMQVSPQNVAIAELAQVEDIDPAGLTRTAQLVANNIAILAKAAEELALAPALTMTGIDSLHEALLPDETHLGVRAVQNWIGGNDWNPLDAEFVPPTPEIVPALMEDLTSYGNSALDAPLIQAALLHAQFETVHPYTDGNGRVGRALIHTVLTRRGLTPYAVLPVSMVLLTRSEEYVRGLTSYRYDGDAFGPGAQAGVAGWLATFLEAAYLAAQQVEIFAAALDELRAEWTLRLSRHRAGLGLRETPRADSAVARTIDLLPEAPVLTSATVQRMLAVSNVAAAGALEELASAGVLSKKKLDRRTTGFLARDVLELVTFTERRLASTRWDTRDSLPNRPSPARPTP